MTAFDGARDHEPLGDALAIGATEYVAGRARCVAEAALEFCAGLALAGLLIALWLQW